MFPERFRAPRWGLEGCCSRCPRCHSAGARSASPASSPPAGCPRLYLKGSLGTRVHPAACSYQKVLPDKTEGLLVDQLSAIPQKGF